ncbi:MAG: TRAM domain-containing protein, partial [Deferribacterales bacterium]
MIYNEIDIFENAYEGYGVGRLPDGKVVFIPFAVAGDNVDILIKKDKKRFAYGEIVKINKRSKYRVDGFCRYEGVCGGCTFAFLDSNYERVVKTQIVEKFFRVIDDFKIDQYIRSEPLQYRLRGRFKVKKLKCEPEKYYNKSELVAIKTHFGEL